MNRLRRIFRWYHPDLSGESENFRVGQHRRGMQAVRAGSIATIIIPILMNLFFMAQGISVGNQALPFIVIGILGYIATYIPFLVKRIVGLSAVAIIVLGQIMAWGIDTVISFPKIDILFAPVALLVIVVATTPIKPVWILVFTLTTIISMWRRNYAVNFYTADEMPLELYIEYFKLFILGSLAVTVRAVIMNTQIIMHRNAESIETALEQLKSAHGRLVQTEKITSQAQLAAAVSHEVNNPLGVVKSNNQTMQSITKKLSDLTSADGGSAKTEIEKLTGMMTGLTDSNRSSVERIEELTSKLQRFTNLDRGDLQEVNVADLLRDSADLLRNLFLDDKHISIAGDEEISIQGNPAELGELFTQLLKNSADAIKLEGDIVINVAREKTGIRIDFKDTGKGIATEALDKIFEPDFKPKDGRMATGWGLFIARQIVNSYGGEINIASEEGKGTQIEVTLPVSQGSGS